MDDPQQYLQLTRITMRLFRMFFFCKNSKILVIGGIQQYLYLRIVQTWITIYYFKIWNQIFESLKKLE